MQAGWFAPPRGMANKAGTGKGNASKALGMSYPALESVCKSNAEEAVAGAAVLREEERKEDREGAGRCGRCEMTGSSEYHTLLIVHVR